MRKISLLILVLLLASVSAIAFSQDKGKPSKNIIAQLTSASAECDLGNIKEGVTIQKKVTLVNKLNEKLYITDVITTCPCLEINSIPKNFYKNDIYEFEITLNSSGLSGDIEEVVYVITNSMEYELLRIVFLAKVVKD